MIITKELDKPYIKKLGSKDKGRDRDRNCYPQQRIAQTCENCVCVRPHCCRACIYHFLQIFTYLHRKTCNLLHATIQLLQHTTTTTTTTTRLSILVYQDSILSEKRLVTSGRLGSRG